MVRTLIYILLSNMGLVIIGYIKIYMGIICIYMEYSIVAKGRITR